jgi:hypothetical protein
MGTKIEYKNHGEIQQNSHNFEKIFFSFVLIFFEIQEEKNVFDKKKKRYHQQNICSTKIIKS